MASPVANNDSITISDASTASILTVASLLLNDTDADNDTLSLQSVSTTSTAGSTLSRSGNNITYTPGNTIQALAAGITATDTFTYLVADPGGNTATGTVTLSLTGVNDTPVLNTPVPDQKLYRSSPFSYTLPTNTFSDPDTGALLTYTVTLSDGSALPEWLSFDTTNKILSGTPPATLASAPLTLKITATDSANTSTSDLFLLSPTNTAPVVNTPASALEAVEKITFSAALPAETFTDADLQAGDTVSYSVTLTNGAALPSWLSFDGTSLTFSGTPPAGSDGALSIRLTAKDSSASSASTDFDLTINNVNDPPALANKLTTVTWSALEPHSFSIPANTFSDLDKADSLTLSAKSSFVKDLPSWLSFDGTTLTGTPSNTQVGIQSVLILAQDGSGSSAAGFLRIKVTYTNQAPLLSRPLPEKTVSEGVLSTFSIPKGSFTDPDKGDSLTFSCGNLPDWIAFDTQKKTFTVMPDYQSSGDYTLEVTATDKAGLSLSTSFLLTIQDNPKIVGTRNHDQLEGDDGDNQLLGKVGWDTLTGGNGADTFVFDVKPSANNFDTLTDFTPGTDKIALSKSIFRLDQLTPVETPEGVFPQLLYSTENQILSFDPDGSGPKQAADLCFLPGVVSLTADDILRW